MNLPKSVIVRLENLCKEVVKSPRKFNDGVCLLVKIYSESKGACATSLVLRNITSLRSTEALFMEFIYAMQEFGITKLVFADYSSLSLTELVIFYKYGCRADINICTSYNGRELVGLLISVPRKKV